jgi:hypothetical protein
MEDKSFVIGEIGQSAALESLALPPEKLDKFEEFHACELYGGYGVFEGIPQQARFEAMRTLLNLLSMLDMHVVFGAVDLDYLNTQSYASADPVDMCFRMCAQGLPIWREKRHLDLVRKRLNKEMLEFTTGNVVAYSLDHILKDLILVIADDCEKKTKESLHKTFRSIRPRKVSKDAPISPFHDDMYFGDSRYSFGIQLADACSYFIGRHLEGDKETEEFYEMIRPRIVYSETLPPELRTEGSVNQDDRTREIRSDDEEGSLRLKAGIAEKD